MKLFILPTSEIVRLSGYEPNALSYLLRTRATHDVQMRNIHPIYYYYNQNVHRYFPDFFLPIENTFVEVKSPWTLTVQYEKNMHKFDAAVKTGFRMRVLVFKNERSLEPCLDTYFVNKTQFSKFFQVNSKTTCH